MSRIGNLTGLNEGEKKRRSRVEDAIRQREYYQKMNDHDLLVEMAVKIEHAAEDRSALHKRIDRVEKWQFGTLSILLAGVAGGLIKLFMG